MAALSLLHQAGIQMDIDTNGWQREPAPVPEWVTLLMYQCRPELDPDYTPPPPRPAVVVSNSALIRDGINAIYDREVARARTAPDGTKQQTTLKAAIVLGGLLHLGLDEHAAEDGLFDAVAPRAQNRGTLRSTIRDGLRYGAQRPFSAADVLPWLREPTHDDTGRPCCPYHGVPLVRCRNPQKLRCTELACRPDGKRFICDDANYTAEAVAAEQRATDAQRKRREYAAEKAARVATINAGLDALAARASADPRLHAEHHSALAVQLTVARGRGWHRISYARLAEEARVTEHTARRIQDQLETWGYITREAVPGHTTKVALALDSEPVTFSAETSSPPKSATSTDIYKPQESLVDPVSFDQRDAANNASDDDDGWASLCATAPASGVVDPASLEWDGDATPQQDTPTGEQDTTPGQVAPVADQDAPEQDTHTLADKSLKAALAEADAAGFVTVDSALWYLHNNGQPKATRPAVAYWLPRVQEQREHEQRRAQLRLDLAGRSIKQLYSYIKTQSANLDRAIAHQRALETMTPEQRKERRSERTEKHAARRKALRRWQRERDTLVPAIDEDVLIGRDPSKPWLYQERLCIAQEVLDAKLERAYAQQELLDLADANVGQVEAGRRVQAAVVQLPAATLDMPTTEPLDGTSPRAAALIERLRQRQSAA